MVQDKVRISCKERSEIISDTFKHRSVYFETSEYILIENSKEFSDQPFRHMTQNLNIVLHITTIESPWSIGLNDQHNGV